MSIGHVLPSPSDRVLSTLNSDGSRRWLRPRLSPGRFLKARRILAWALIAIFTLLPFVRVGNAPAILLDVARRQFTLFGKTFLPTDTVLLAVLLLGIVVLVFLVTAVLGRVWCGWACPQTVYMEFVYRPIERLFDGPPGRGGTLGRKASGARTAAKLFAYLAISMGLAHTFLSYFVGVENLRIWMTLIPRRSSDVFCHHGGNNRVDVLRFHLVSRANLHFGLPVRAASSRIARSRFTDCEL